MAVDMFLKIGDIKGESVDKTHKDEIDILSWSWGLSQSGTTHQGPGGGAGKVNVQDISITKYVDKASPNLIKSCCKGSHIPNADLVVRKAGGNPLEYIKLSLEEVLISAVTTGGSGGEDRLTESVTLNFARFKFTYAVQGAKGDKVAEIPVGFNIPENVAT